MKSCRMIEKVIPFKNLNKKLFLFNLKNLKWETVHSQILITLFAVHSVYFNLWQWYWFFIYSRAINNLFSNQHILVIKKVNQF